MLRHTWFQATHSRHGNLRANPLPTDVQGCEEQIGARVGAAERAHTMLQQQVTRALPRFLPQLTTLLPNVAAFSTSGAAAGVRE